MDPTTIIFIVIATIVAEKVLERLASNVKKLCQNWKEQIKSLTSSE